MTVRETPDYAAILERVQQWPAEDRARLLRDVRPTLPPFTDAALEIRPIYVEAFGLLETDAPPPTDEELEQWLDEHRLEKYG